MPGPTPYSRLATERLTLRPLRLADAAPMTTLLNDFDIARMVSRVPYPYALDDARAYLAHLQNADPTRERVFALESGPNGLIGVIGLDPSLDGDVTELGYWLGRPFWGHGYMTEAVSAVLKWARGEWGRRYLVAGHFADNPRSGRVLTKAGFLYTGDVRQRHSLARGEPVSSRLMVWLA